MQGHPPVPVVYGIIYPYDSIHFVRVQKTFDINSKSELMSLDNESMRYEDVEVFMYGKVGDSLVWKEQFFETQLVRDDGFFPSEGFQSFCLDHPLPINTRGEAGVPDIDSLVLEVIVNDQGITARASSCALNKVRVISYKSPYTFYAYGSRPSCFALPNIGESYTRSENSVDKYKQIEFCVHYKDYFEDFHKNMEMSWRTNKGWDGGAYFITPERFFNRLRVLLPKNDSILSRRFDSIDITLIEPSKFFNDYWFVREHWEDSDRPPYTNFDNSYGIFFTVAKAQITGQKLDSQTLDSLCNGYFYKEMKFKNW